MPWLEDRKEERCQALADRDELWKQFYPIDLAFRSIFDDAKGSPYTAKQRDVIHFRTVLARKLGLLGRTIQYTTELIKRENYMSLRNFPPEVREMIMKLVLIEDDPIDIANFDLYRPNLGLFGACKELRHESRAIFYKYNTFVVRSNLAYSVAFSTYSLVPLPFLQNASLPVDWKADMRGFFSLVEKCPKLERLSICLSSIPRDAVADADEVASIQFERPSQLGCVTIEGKESEFSDRLRAKLLCSKL